MKMVSCLAVVAIALALPATALALAQETFGNSPFARQPGWADGVLEVVNLHSRVYSIWVNGNENFYYRGDAVALNEAIRKFAAIKGSPRRLVVLPGRGIRQTFGAKAIDFDWQLHVPSGIYAAVAKEKDPVLTVYLDAAKPRGAVDRERVVKLIAELDSDSFETRQKAEQALEKLGFDAKPYLREALKASPPLEPRRRMEQLLKKLHGIDASDLDVPKGVTVVTVDDLMAEHLARMKDKDPTVCGIAIQGLTNLAAFSNEVVPAVTEMLKKDRNEYVRRVAAGCLGQLGAKARPSMAALKEGLDDRDTNVRQAFKVALESIEKAESKPVEKGEAKRRAAIRKDIDEVKKATVGK